MEYNNSTTAGTAASSSSSSPPPLDRYAKLMLMEVGIICKPARAHLHPFGILRGFTTLDFSFFFVLMEMALILLITLAVRCALKPLRQPKVISDMVAGIIIGPSVLGRSKRFQEVVFSDSSQYVVRNLGLIGFIYFLFIAGVKTDLAVIKKAGKKQWIIALSGIVIPFVVIMGVAMGVRKRMDTEMAKFSSFGGIAAALVITNFPVMHSVLQDLNLLSSEIGRLAMSTVIIGDAMGINMMVAFEACKQGEVRALNALYYVLALVVVMLFLYHVVPRIMSRINRNTPQGKPVEQSCVTLILLGVFVIAFTSDFIGAAIANGPLWYGLAIPDGPPLGATLVERTETLVSHLFLPFSYTCLGLLTDVFSLSTCWSCLFPLFLMFVVGFVSKLVSIVAATQYFFKMPFREGFTLGLMLSLRGQVEFLLFMHWLDWRMINIPSLTMLILMTTILTGILSPLISVLYDPTRPYMTNKRRTIQHTPPNSELRVVGCIFDQESSSSLCNLVDICNPTPSNPFAVFALHLIEIKGRASPVFIDHWEQLGEYWDSTDETIHNALSRYEEARSDCLSVRLFTCVTAGRTMYQDVCELALLKKATLMILPFHVKCLEETLMCTGSATSLVRPGVQALNTHCLVHAPCSVAILVRKGSLEIVNPISLLNNNNNTNIPTPGRTSFAYTAASSFSSRSSSSSSLLYNKNNNPNYNNINSSSYRRLAMLFLGGADAREALTLADRMVGDPNSTLTVVRFLSHNYAGDNELERKLDDGVVTAFWVKNERNDRVSYREIIVNNGEETITAIRTLNTANNYIDDYYNNNDDDHDDDDHSSSSQHHSFDLWIVGRMSGINPLLLQGLSDWSENPELGLVGDYLASPDFSSTASVLVLQQQILRDDTRPTFACLRQRPKSRSFIT